MNKQIQITEKLTQIKRNGDDVQTDRYNFRESQRKVELKTKQTDGESMADSSDGRASDCRSKGPRFKSC